MPSRSLWFALLLVGPASCYSAPEHPPTGSGGPPETSEVVFQAVDAGTGSTLLDDRLTVRYLVRSPITLDASGVEEVSSSEPYHIAQGVSDPELVVEVRLEAPSYFRLDTVLTVARGGSAGPLTLRLARRLDRVAAADTGTSSPPAASKPAADPSPPPSRPTPGNALAAARAVIQAGDRAYQAGDWLRAIQAYEKLTPPESPTSTYGREYRQALVRRGVAHIKRGEFGSALEALEEAARYEDAGYNALLRLGEAQCAVGRTEEGRGTLAELGRNLAGLPEATRPMVTSLIQYERGVCSHGEFDRAATTRDRVRTGAAAIRDLEAFTQAAGGITPQPRELQEAVADAEARIQRIREQIRG